jgi:predicted choloylglycine hydrolase
VEDTGMKKIFTDVLQFRGSHYDYGFRQGKLLKDSILIKNRERQWKVRKPLFRINIEETKRVFQQFAPSIWLYLYKPKASRERLFMLHDRKAHP